MGLAADVTLAWGDGEYTFALKAAQIEELQRICGQGQPVAIGTISSRVFIRQFYNCDIREAIRLGLIGGGTASVRAKQLVETYVDAVPFDSPKDPSSPYKTAVAIYNAMYFGLDTLEPTDETPGGGESRPIDFAAYRAKCLELGVDPVFIDGMSLYQLFSTVYAYAKKDQGDTMSDEEFAKMNDILRNLPGVKL
jgi:hypothetical protein